MDPTLDAFIRSWPFDPWLSTALLLAAGIYARGWVILQNRDPRRWPLARLVAFIGGLASLFLALASPIEPFASLLLQVHMAQHLLLTMVAPPLLWLGTPLMPMLRGLPESVRKYWVAPILRSRRIRAAFQRLTHPFTALPLFIAATWLWHAPRLYELALRSPGWHYVQHICFIASALIFWYPVVRPYPGRPRWSAWMLFPYLIIADVQNTVLSALLTFSDRVLYASYAEAPRLGGLSALDDQSAAGVLMWVPGSLVYLLPLFAMAIRLLSGAAARQPKRRSAPAPVKSRLPILNNAEFLPNNLGRSRSHRLDLTTIPVLGQFLRWKHARAAFQIPMAILAGVLIYDGLFGPQIAPMNLAGVLPWIHWRGVIILGLLAAGNLSCMACPFTLPRSLGRRWLPSKHDWPPWLKSKWLAVVLVGLFLWAYDAFALWDRPYATAMIIAGYFLAALAIDGVFRGASFCKYVCPIGQFNFVQSLVSPLEVGVRDQDICASCRTRDCIRGRGDLPGCEMELFQPRKSSNMDCTFCLDCVHACPHANVGVLAETPMKTLWSDPVRSGIGVFSQRPDVAVLVVILVFGAFANAAGMVRPVVAWQDAIRSVLRDCPPLLVTTFYYSLTLLIAPCITVGTAAILSRTWSRAPRSGWEMSVRFAFSLIPLGFAMWLAHYLFHFLGSFETIVPVVERFAAEHGWPNIGAPQWALACCRPVAGWLPRLEIVCLDIGLLASLYTGFRIALDQEPDRSTALKAFLPWGGLIVLLFAVGIWIVLQPMEMRGTMPAA